MRFPPALAKLFAGTALASTVAAAPAAPAAGDDDEDQGAGTGANARPAGVSETDAARIRANAETAIAQAVTEERTRWATVLNHETGEGDAKASIMSQPVRAETAMQLLADTDLEPDKIIATVSKPAFAVAPAGTDAHGIAAAAARERLRGEEHRTQTGPGANGNGAGGDGTGAGGADAKAEVKTKVAATRKTRNDQTRAQMGQPAA